MRTRLLRIERYVLTNTLFAVAATTAIIGAIVLLINFVELSRNFGGRTDASFLEVASLTLLKTPLVILTLLPFVFLFGTLAAFISLNRRSELIAMRAAGVSAGRFILPAAISAAVLGIAAVTVLNPVAAASEAAFERLRGQINPDAAEPRRVWLRQGDGRTQVIIGAASTSPAQGVRLNGVSMFIFLLDQDDQPVFARRIEAEHARLLPGYWLLTRAREATPGRAALRYETLSIPSTLDVKSALEKFASPQSISFWSLPGAIRRISEAGFSTTTYRLRLHQLLATPLLFAAMAFLAAVFSLKLMRLGGLFRLAGVGVAVGFLFFFFDQLCGSLGKAGILPPFVAAWVPPLLALLSGFTVLFYTEDG